jgi:hypothetical protein
MISYARILKDGGSINPTESASTGISGGNVAYNRYKNDGDTAGQGAFASSNGNKVFSLSSFTPTSDGRSTYYDLQLTEAIYNASTVGNIGLADFDQQEMKDFTEPFYIVNIIQTGKDVSDLNINTYTSTGHYQKIESVIGEGDGLNNQSYELVDERWEDCVPSLTSTGFNNAGESFIYLVDANLNSTAYLNVTYYSAIDIATIEADILANGFYVTPGGKTIYGIYTHTSDSEDIVTVVFNYPLYNPQVGFNIVVKYDETRPIIFHGGDTVVGENIFAPIDKEADDTASDADNQFIMNIGFPYRRYDVNENYFIKENVIDIQASDECRIGYLRQLCIMYAAESKTATNFQFNSDYPLAYFPLTHYIMRPLEFNDALFGTGIANDIAVSNELFEEYFDDYPNEWELWKYGGFRFKPSFNVDYSAVGPFNAFSKPDVGFEEQNKFCSGVTWSLSRAINQQDSPGLKTFLGGNKFLASDDNGGIVKAWNAMTGDKGDNLYGITESGIILFLTKKAILSNINGNDLTTTAFDAFISGEYWLSRKIGSNGEMWRGMADASVEIKTQNGSVEEEALFIPNKHSIYRLMENQIVDIAKDNYLSRMKSSLAAIGEGYSTKIVGHFDKNHNEYWFQMPDELDADINKCFVFSQDTNFWAGRFTYNFDSYTYGDNKNYGFKNLAMFELDKGFLIDNDSITAYLIPLFSPELTEEKEFIAIEVNTGPRGEMKPTEIIFLDEKETELSRLNNALFGANYLKQYSGWWNQIPRKEVSVSANRERIQYRLLLCKIIHNFEEDFKIVSTVIQYKNLK